jgi:hypothetical protein
MPDFDAITLALVARFSPAQVTAPTGYDPITLATGDLPEGLVPTPCVLVYPNSGELRYFPGKRDATHDFTVRFYFNQIGDLERDTVALRKWLTVLVDQLRVSSQLAGIVTSARVIEWAIAVLPYGGVEYTGIELTVSIVTNEPWSAVA